MQNTSNQKIKPTWVEQQEEFIASLKSQPLIVVCRATLEELESPKTNCSIFSLLDHLNTVGVKHVEIAWSPHPKWKPLIQEAKSCFSNLRLGSASITTPHALKTICELELSYATTPFWDPILQALAKELNQTLIPGVFSPSEIKKACDFGHRIIKIFPASSLGVDYWPNLKPILNPLPFVIAAGGLEISDFNPWLLKGYGAIALGRKLIKNGQIDPSLQGALINLRNEK